MKQKTTSLNFSKLSVIELNSTQLISINGGTSNSSYTTGPISGQPFTTKTSSRICNTLQSQQNE